MRSRFAAYALGLVDYVVATTDPAGPQWGEDEAAWRASIERFCEGTRFAGLRILAAEDDHVTFAATLEQRGPDGARHDASFTERSRFTQVDGQWRYHSGEQQA